MTSRCFRIFTIAMLGLVGGQSLVAVPNAAPAAATKPAVDGLPATSEAGALKAAWEKSDYSFTPEVKTAFLVFAKAQAKAELVKAGLALPNDFLAWVDSDPVVEASVYG